MTLVENALEWAKQGVPVFPTGENKTPLTPNGHKDGSTDPRRIRAMFEQAGNRAAGIGATMGERSQLFAIDADTYKPGAAGESARSFVADLTAKGLLVATRVHRTKNGGTHYIYFSETAWPNCNPVAGVEVKGEGGYIIVPETPGYEVVSDELAYAPEGLLDYLKARKTEISQATVSELKAAVLSGESFHDALNQMAAKLSAQGMDQVQVQNEVLNTLAASVARVPGHPRHARWAKLVADAGGELSRITSSGHEKFHPDASGERLRAAAERAGLLGSIPIAPPRIEGLGAPVVPPAKQLEDLGSDWPFDEHKGYFGHSKLDVLSQTYIAYPLLSEDETTIISAEPKAGKTLVTQTLCMHIAAGSDLGAIRIPKSRPVLYFALESQLAIRRRLVAWKSIVDPQNTLLTKKTFPFYVFERPINLMDEKARQDLAVRIAAADRWFQANGFAPLGATVFDTLTKTMAGGDQNSVEDTSAVFDVIGMVRDLGVHSSMLFIHHDKRGAQQTRGSSNIEAEPDTLLGLVKDKETDEMLLNVRMARSIEDEQVFRFGRKSVSLGVSEQGFDIAAPVLFPSEGEVIPEKRLAIVDNERKVLELLVSMGTGRKLAKDFHSLLGTKLTENEYPVLHKRLGSKEITMYFEHLIPATGRIVDGKFVVMLETVKSTKNGAIMVSSFLVRRMAPSDAPAGATPTD